MDEDQFRPPVHEKDFRRDNLLVFGFRVPASLSGMTGGEFGKITFVFETICSADCELYFMMVRVYEFAGFEWDAEMSIL